MIFWLIMGIYCLSMWVLTIKYTRKYELFGYDGKLIDDTTRGLVILAAPAIVPFYWLGKYIVTIVKFIGRITK